MRKRRRGFSLIELLLVIVIIAILGAMILPAFSKAREKAKQAVCANNLKQIGIAFFMYVQDYEFFPCADDPVSTSPVIFLWMGRGWRQLLKPYISDSISPLNPSILFCPSDKTAQKKWESTSYAYSMAFYHSPEQINILTTQASTYTPELALPCIPQKLSQVRFPHKKVLAGEWLDNHTGEQNSWWSWSGARNYLFADGHVEFVKANQILPANDGFPDPNLTINGIAGKDLP